MKNKKTHPIISTETAINLILLGAIMLAYAVYALFFGRQPKEKPHVNRQPVEQRVSGCNGDCGCCRCKDDQQDGTYKEPLWEY